MRGRFAPSPTGRFHLGNARTALVAWLQVRKAGGRLIMRVEDLDPQRCRSEHEVAQLADLRWLGLDWDEGPDVGGAFGPYRQSERAEIHGRWATQLDTYPCTCSRKEVQAASIAPHGAEPVYPGICREAPSHPDRPAALRWRVPPGVVEVHDPLAGTLRQNVAEEVGDFVIRRSDGAWAYQLAVVVDDALMEISHVCRGVDLWQSTPRQVALQRALGFATPHYAHVPLVLGPDGQKLNKRHGAPDLTALREGGADPEVVVALLAQSAGLLEAGVERLRPSQLLESFDLASLRHAQDVIAPGPLEAYWRAR